MDEDRGEGVTWAPWFRYLIGLVVAGVFVWAAVVAFNRDTIHIDTALYALMGIIVSAIFPPFIRRKKPPEK